MKICVTSDWHIDNRTRGFDRSQDVLGAIEYMVAEANRQGCEHFVFCGDLLDAHDPDEHCWTYLYEVYRRLNELEAKIWMIPGNHDVVDVRGCTNPLSLFEMMPECNVYPEPAWVWWEWRQVVAVFLPHLSPVGWSVTLSAQERLEAQLHAPAFQRLWGCTGDLQILVFSHLELDQVEYGSERDMPRGAKAPRVPQWLLEDRRVKAVFQGHYHRPQQIGKIHIIGSPERHSFAEEHDQKSFLIVDV